MKKELTYLFLLVSGILFSQSTGSLDGRVIDSKSQLPLEGATIILRGTSLGVVTNQYGYFSINDIPTKTYNIEVSYLGFETETLYNVIVKSVNEPKPAKINEDLAKKFGAKNLTDLKDQIKERLKAEYGHASRVILKRELMDKLDKSVKFDLPSGLIEIEANQIAHQLWHEENPENKDHKHDKIIPTDEHNKIASRRVKLGLLLAELGSKNKLVVSEKETQDALIRKAQEYPGQEKAFVEYIQKNPEAREQLKAPIFEDKVIDFIIELSSVTEKKVSKDELKKAVEKIESM